jgi:KipI family sensor histidine kinase inhibitor
MEAWRWVGDRALLREFAGDLPTTNRAARALYHRLRALASPEVEDVVPGARSVLVLLRDVAPPSAVLAAALSDGADGAEGAGEPTRHEILVAYGGEDGPDLEDLARMHGLAPGDVVERHAAAWYTVAFLGFSPGFAYLLGLPPELATPRLATPRTRVPAGSVAIGDVYSAVYPRATPGGWRLVGRAETTLFDPRSDPPARLLPGDRVRFVPR